MAIVSKPLNATLIHHTGTFIRFHRTDARFLPAAERRCEIELPDGRVVAGKFASNRDLFNINGRDLVRWIKSWLPRTASARVVVHPVGTADRIRLELLGSTPVKLTQGERRSVLGKAPKTRGLGGDRKRQAFLRWERDPALRRIVLEVWGTQCQVKGCAVQAAVTTLPVRERLVDVHHLLSVSLGGDDSAANLVVLCLMHHHLLHRASTVTQSTKIGRVDIVADGVRLEVARNLEILNRARASRSSAASVPAVTISCSRPSQAVVRSGGRGPCAASRPS